MSDNNEIKSKVQEERNELRDTQMEIRDLEAELEFMHLREPNEHEYICYLEARMRELYDKLETFDSI